MSERVEFYRDQRGETRWRLVGGNNEIVTQGSEGYTTRQGAEWGLKRTAEILWKLGYLEADIHYHAVYPRLWDYLQAKAAGGEQEAIEIIGELEVH